MCDLRGGGGGGGGGGASHLFSIRRLGPSVYCYPPKKKKYQEYQAPQNNSLKFLHHPKITPFCTYTLRKAPKIHGNDP